MQNKELKRLQALARLSDKVSDYKTKKEFASFQKRKKDAIKRLEQYAQAQALEAERIQNAKKAETESRRAARAAERAAAAAVKAELEAPFKNLKIFTKAGTVRVSYMQKFTGFKSFVTNFFVDIFGAGVRDANGALLDTVSVRELFARDFWAQIADYYQIATDTQAIIFCLGLAETYKDLPDIFFRIFPKFVQIPLGVEPYPQDGIQRLAQTALMFAEKSPERIAHFRDNPYIGKEEGFFVWQMRKGTIWEKGIDAFIDTDEFSDNNFKAPKASTLTTDTTIVPGLEPEELALKNRTLVNMKIWKIRNNEPFTSDQQIFLYRTTDLKTTRIIIFYPTPNG